MSIPDCLVVQEYTIFLPEGQYREQALTRLKRSSPGSRLGCHRAACVRACPSLHLRGSGRLDDYAGWHLWSQLTESHGPVPAIAPGTGPCGSGYCQRFGRIHRTLLERHWGQVRSALRLKKPVQR